MTDQTTTADANTVAAGADSQAGDLAVATIDTVKAKARALLLEIETAGASLHLTNAVSAITSAIQYMGRHFKEIGEAIEGKDAPPTSA